jgi:hypothetical protein
MRRFRYTLLAICLVLLFLGIHDLRLLLRNPQPAVVSITDLEKSAPSQEWLTVSDGIWNLQQAISTSGTIEIEAFLVPLRNSDDPNAPIKVMIETRDPAVIDLLKTYYFSFDNDAEQAAFLAANLDRFIGRHEITGMVIGGLIASGNRDKLIKLAQELKMPVGDDVLFISDGQQPGKVSGIFFTVMALFGIGRFVQLMRRPSAAKSDG